MLEELFTFPVAVIDGDNEEKKLKGSQLIGDESPPYDIAYGEAEYPYYDFIGIEDRWLPTEKSFQKALDGKFEACVVRFANVGNLLVPWSRKKFKEELIKFTKDYEVKHPPEESDKELKIITLTPEQFREATGDGNEG